MVIMKRNWGRAQNTFVALLEGEEVNYPARVLITMADNEETKISKERLKELTAKYPLGERPPRMRHFGGTVDVAPGRKDKTKTYAKITVYTD